MNAVAEWRGDAPSISAARLDEIVGLAAPHSDTDLEQMTWYAARFVEAQQRVRGMVVEFGTRAGGSAYLWLLLLRELFGDAAPLVATVDPYGDRPYNDGRLIGRFWYGQEHYVAQRTLLAPFANHVHWLLPSREFLALIVQGLSYWHVGTSYGYRDIAWAYLDGEHDVDSISHEVTTFLETPHLMAPGGTIAVDNVEWAPTTIDFLTPYCPVYNDRRSSALLTAGGAA